MALANADWAMLAATTLPNVGRPYVDFGQGVTMMVPISAIDTPSNVSGAVDLYRQRLRDGVALDPVHVWRNGDDRWRVVEGGDRLWAATREGATEIECVIASATV